MRPRSLLALAVLFLFAGGPVGTALGQTRRPPPAKRPAVTKSLRKAPAKPLKKAPAKSLKSAPAKNLKSTPAKGLKQAPAKTLKKSSEAKPGLGNKTPGLKPSRSLKAEFNAKARTVSGKATARKSISLEKKATATRPRNSQAAKDRLVQARLDRLGRRLAGGDSRSNLAAPRVSKRITRVAVSSISPAERGSVLQTLRHIDAGTKPTGPLAKKWGEPFQNRRGDLPGPQGKASPYRAYRVAPDPGVTGAGRNRIVINQNTGEAYYTWTHYGDAGHPAFVQIR